MGKQFGFGWGKGRHVIKTIYAGDRLQAALARQREWFRLHGVEHAAPQRITPERDATEVKPGLYVATVSTSVFSADTTKQLRMAKARLRSERR